MPFVQIYLMEGRTEDQKRAVIEKVTAAVVEAVPTFVLGGAGADYGELDLARAVFGNGDILADQCRQCGTAGLAELERGVCIIGQKYLLNAGLRRLPLRDQLDQAVEDGFHAIGQGLLGIHADAAAVYIAPAATFGGDDAVAGNA